MLTANGQNEVESRVCKAKRLMRVNIHQDGIKLADFLE
jgi:hypothetical protein